MTRVQHHTIPPAHRPRPTPVAVAPRRADDSSTPLRSSIWVLAANADACSAEERGEFVRAVAARGWSERPDRLLLVTCHRAEIYGAGPSPEPQDVVRSLPFAGLAPRLRLLRGETAVRHALRLAAGLESAVVGEDQVLHQVRELREAARHRPTEPHLSRLLEVAIGVGRRARAARAGASRSDMGLAARALDWLCLHGLCGGGDRLLVVGAGQMGRLLAMEAHRRGMAVTVASRNEERAASLASRVGGRGVGLAEAARMAASQDAVAVALAGPWLELPAWASLPPIVDLSSPPSIAPRGDGRHLDIDGLYRWNEATRPRPDDLVYEAKAVALVEEATARFRRWSNSRPSVETLRSLRDRAERRRAADLRRLLQRLPDLEPREQALVEAFSEQLVAALLHSPSARLRDDADGSAAAAARRLFDL